MDKHRFTFVRFECKGKEFVSCYLYAEPEPILMYTLSADDFGSMAGEALEFSKG